MILGMGGRAWVASGVVVYIAGIAGDLDDMWGHTIEPEAGCHHLDLRYWNGTRSALYFVCSLCTFAALPSLYWAIVNGAFFLITFALVAAIYPCGQGSLWCWIIFVSGPVLCLAGFLERRACLIVKRADRRTRIERVPQHKIRRSQKMSQRVLGATALSYRDSLYQMPRIETLKRSASRHGVALDVICNLYDAPVQLKACLLTVHMREFKGLFWLRHITPARARAYDFIWMFDNDLDVQHFALWGVVEAMVAYDAMLAQPRVRRHSKRRSTDHPHLRVHTRCAACRAQCTDFVEVMTPVFTRRAWFHTFDPSCPLDTLNGSRRVSTASTPNGAHG